MLSATLVEKEQQIEPAVHTGTLKQNRLEKYFLVLCASISVDILMTGSQFGVNSMKTWIHPACVNGSSGKKRGPTQY